MHKTKLAHLVLIYGILLFEYGSHLRKCVVIVCLEAAVTL